MLNYRRRANVPIFKKEGNGVLQISQPDINPKEILEQIIKLPLCKHQQINAVITRNQEEILPNESYLIFDPVKTS